MEPRPDTWLENAEVDALVLGTGILQSLVACALARAGKRVVHFDQEGFYGEHEAALSLQDLVELLSRQAAQAPTDPLAFRRDATPFSNVVVHSNPSAVEFLQKENRAFCIDLCPRPIFADEGIVRVFVRSGVHQYLEFKTLDKVFLCSQHGKNLLPVPNSRNDVFSSKVVDLKEKRLMMKFIQTCSAADSDFLRDHGSEKFVDFLRAQELTPNLESFLLYAITLTRSNQSTPDAEVVNVADGIARIKIYMTSASIYGSTPFLYPLYGLGEISQAYCRAAAVSGCTYVLKRSLTRMLVGPDGAVSGAVCTEGQEFKAKIIVTSCEYLNNGTLARRLARCVCVLNGSLLHGEERSTLSVIPPGTFDNAAAVHILQLDPSLHVCPRGKFLLQITSYATPGRTAQEELSPIVKALCDVEGTSAPPAAAAHSEDNTTPARPAVIWHAYFNEDTFRAPSALPAGLHVVPDIGALPGVSWSAVLETAERMFATLVPGAAFLARTVGQPDETQEAATESSKPLE